jgi:tetratricopeptide (TPR) repeat protein
MLGEMPEENSSPLRVPDHELVRRIGVGSYGEVWLARNVVGTWRAIKVVRRARFDSDRPYDREFNGIQKFEPISRSHSSQVDILHLGRNDAQGYFYYVMELADDAAITPLTSPPSTLDPATYSPHTLKNDADRHRRFPIDECITIGLALTDGLEHLHSHGLVHRDVKPSNIVFIGGSPKLADIGLVTDADATRTFVGTEGFLPPEGAGTPQADLYALGKVLYEISTGKDRREFPQAPADLDTMPERKRFLELAEIIEKACDPDLKKRYVNAAAMRGDLSLLQSGQSVRAQRARARQMMWLRKAALATAGAGLVFALGMIASIWLKHGTKPTAEEQRGTQNPQAWNAYRLARFYQEQRTTESISNALVQYERAVRLDPKFARAWAGLAHSHHLSANYLGTAPRVARPKVREAAERALALDESLSDAHLALAVYQRDFTWDLSAAEKEFKRALELEPNNALACQWYSAMLGAQGRHGEALAQARRAVELEPSSLVVNANLGARLYIARDFEAAIAQYRRVVAMNPNFALAHRELAYALEASKRYPEAVAEFLAADRLTPTRAETVAEREAAFQSGGWRGFWEKELEIARRAPDFDEPSAYPIHVRLGNLEPAFDWLEEMIAERGASFIHLATEPLFDVLRHDKRFAALLKATHPHSPTMVHATSSILTKAERAGGLTEEEKRAGFKLIFNGQSLKGWTGGNNWIVRDGTITREGSGGNLSYVAEAVPEHFELRFEWKLPVNGDSGIYYRPGMVQYQLVDASNVQARTSFTRAGALFMGFGPAKEFSQPAGEWNESRIICRGTTVEHWLNGERVVAMDYTKEEWAEPLARLREHELRRFKRNSGDLTARGGHLALESLSNGEVSFRHLRWRKFAD